MAVTIKDIAKQAGVSHSTVSRALRGSPLITPQTTERIQQIAGALNYRPSSAARSLRTSRSQVLGVVVSSLDDPFFSEILQGIESIAQEFGYSLFVAAAQHEFQREQKIIQTMVEHRVDGVIICSTPFSTEHAQILLEYGRPIVVINNQSAEEYRYSIYHDDVDGSRQLTRHLIELGHRRIAYLGNIASGRTTLDRLSGFHQEMDAAGLVIHPGYVHQAPGGGPAEGEAAVSHFLDLPNPPTALVCFNDMVAVGVLKGLRLAGLRVPEDFSVAGFDNIVFSAYTQPPLTTFDQPKRFIGAEAARLILGSLILRSSRIPPFTEKSVCCKGELLVRESTAPPPP